MGAARVVYARNENRIAPRRFRHCQPRSFCRIPLAETRRIGPDCVQSRNTRDSCARGCSQVYKLISCFLEKGGRGERREKEEKVFPLSLG
jgi:hypothetical protein